MPSSEGGSICKQVVHASFSSQPACQLVQLAILIRSLLLSGLSAESTGSLHYTFHAGLHLEQVLFVEEEDHRRLQEPLGVADLLEELQRLEHAGRGLLLLSIKATPTGCHMSAPYKT